MNRLTAQEILARLIAIPSVNPMGRDLQGDIYFESRLSDWLEHYLQGIGANYLRIPIAPGRDNIVAYHEGEVGSPLLLLDAHQDTVPVDGMSISPFDPVVVDGRMYGRGSCDVKGGLAAMLWAFTQLVLERPPGSCSVTLSCTCDEEATTLGINDLVRLWSEPARRCEILPRRPDYAIVAEPTDLNVVVAHLGVLRFRLRTEGVACHSSNPALGINAIYEMAAVIKRLQDIAQDLRNSTARHPLCGGPALSVGVISGGSAVNIVPDQCTIEVDRRLVPGESPQGVRHDLQSNLESEFTRARCQAPWIQSPALSDHDNHALANLLREITHLAGSNSQLMGVPYCTHASTISQYGVPSVVYGPGSILQAHTRDESIDLAELEKAARVYYRACIDGRQLSPH